ncbi:MAG: hypothetical protein EBZ40_07215 [Gammaproteobacteria bacterium]|nr:hypothetical protein [Gammaproteobacteria bacterium]
MIWLPFDHTRNVAMIIQTVVQSAISRARRRNRSRVAGQQSQATVKVEREDAAQIRRSSRREDLGVMVVVLLFSAIIIGFFVAG